MKKSLGLILVACFLAAADPVPDKAVKEELDRLQGTWTMAALEVDGKPVPEKNLQKTILTIKGNKYIVKVGDDIHETTLKLDPSKKPREVDMTFLDGPNKGKVGKGIYDFDGDTFRLCRTLSPDKDRPTDFGTWPNTGTFLVTWKRQATDK